MYPSQSIAFPHSLQGASSLRRVFSEVRTVPGIVLVVLVTTLYGGFGGPGLGGFAGTGFAWIVPLTVALFCFLRPRPAAAAPLLIWLPWLVVILGHGGAARERYEIQRSIMFICPMIVGLAVSMCRAGPRQLRAFLMLCKFAAVFLWLTILFRTNLVFETALLGWGASGAGLVMTTALLGALFAVEGVIKGVRYLLGWLTMAAIPSLLVARMGIVVSIVVLPFTAAPLRWQWRLGLLCCGGGLMLAVFMLPSVQQKMFFTGHGELADLTWDNSDLRTNARKAMWDAMLVDIAKKPWLGYGTAAALEWVEGGGWELAHPHNDWLRLLYNYGIIGCAAFLICAGIQIYHLFRIAGSAASLEVRILAYTGVSSFVALFLFMITDNIINYPNFFGNLQFTIIGLVYAASGTGRIGGGPYTCTHSLTGR